MGLEVIYFSVHYFSVWSFAHCETVTSPETQLATAVMRQPDRLAPTQSPTAAHSDRRRVPFSPGAMPLQAIFPATDTVRRLGARAAHTVLQVRPAGPERLAAARAHVRCCFRTSATGYRADAK